MNYEEQKTSWRPPSITYYYRNVHGKVVALNEDVAFEQHSIHPQYLGSSLDLKRTGYNELEYIVKHLEQVDDKTLPIDKRKQMFTKSGGWEIKGQHQQIDINKLVAEQVAQKLKEYGIDNQKQKGQNQPNSGNTP